MNKEENGQFVPPPFERLMGPGTCFVVHAIT